MSIAGYFLHDPRTLPLIDEEYPCSRKGGVSGISQFTHSGVVHEASDKQHKAWIPNRRQITKEMTTQHGWGVLIISKYKYTYKTSSLTHQVPRTPTTTSTAHQSNRGSRSKTAEIQDASFNQQGDSGGLSLRTQHQTPLCRIMRHIFDQSPIHNLSGTSNFKCF